MIKVTYYIGTCDKDSCKKELLDRDFYKVFDELFVNYTLQRAEGVFTMQNSGTVVKEETFIVTTFIEESSNEGLDEYKINTNAEIMKSILNQESILVEVSKPEGIFL